MKTKHSPGTMSVFRSGTKTWLETAIDDNGPVAEITGGSQEDLANAARLALCWNMHDELAEALRGMLQAIKAMPPDYQDSPYVWSRTCDALAVLSKLEGGDREH